jgi:hypothetical protein
MISGLTLARIGALVAILGFFMPWAEVSCSGQPVSHATGIQLITGDVGGAGAPPPVHHDLWVAAALALIVLGLAGSLLSRGRRAAAIAMAAALAAALASLVGVSREVPSADVQAQLANGGSGAHASAQAADQIVSAQIEYGYFVTLGGLVAAVVGGALALAGQRPPDSEPG